MKNRVISYLARMHVVAGVEIYRQEDESQTIRYVNIKRKGNIASFENGEYHLKSVSGLHGQLGASPIALSLCGKGIISRAFASEENYDALDYARKIVPTATADTFCIQAAPIGKVTFVSMCRRSTIDSILESFEKEELEIHTLTLGPFALTSVWEYLPAFQQDAVQFDGHRFTLLADQPVGYEPLAPTATSKIVRFAEQEMNESLLIAYASGLCLVGGVPFPHISLESFGVSTAEFHDRSIFKRLFPLVLGFFLFALLTNTFFYSYYTSQTYDDSAADIETLRNAEEKLTDEINRRQNLKHGITRPSSTDYGSMARISDLLAACQPASVTLDALNIFPRSKGRTKARKPEYDFSLVTINGKCKNGTELNEWISAIRQFSFVETVEIAAYSSIEKENLSAFTLNLRVR